MNPAEPEPQTRPRSAPTTRVDLVVIGGGLAGLTAGLRAAEAGLRVFLVEQGDGADYPCNSRYSGGIFHVSYTDMMAPPDVLRAAIERATGGECAPDQADAISRNAGRAVAWLRERGTDFVRASAVDWHRWTVAPPRPLRPGLSYPGCGLDPLLRRLSDLLQSRDGVVSLGTRAVGLERRANGGLVVVVAAQGHDPRSVETAAVVLADGGFQGDAEMVRRHVSPRPDLLVQRGAGTGRGDALRLAVALGAASSRMDRFYGHLLSRDALVNPDLRPYPQLDAAAIAGIVVDPGGRRFADESRGGVYLANLIAARSDPSDAVAILDGALWETAGRSSLYPANPNLETAGGTIHRADTVADLARSCGLPPDALGETVERYNAAVTTGGGLDPSRLSPGKPIVAPPFLAIPLAVGITHTMGGVRVDESMRVLRSDGPPIAGLYGAGASTGGLEGGDTVGYVGGLVKAAVMGLLAAEHAAEFVSGRPVPAAAPVLDAPPSGAAVPMAPGRPPHFRFLKLAVRYGALAAVPISLVGGGVAALAITETGMAVRWAAFVLVSAIVYVALRTCIDLATLIDEMLLPKP